MKQKGSVGTVVLILLLVLAVILGVGYYVFLYPQQQLQKARTPDGSLNKVTDSLLPRSQVKVSGYNVGMIISPSVNDVISGQVTITVLDPPEGTKHVGFSISENFEDLGEGGPNLGFDSDGAGGWEKTLDTTEYTNGPYYIALFVFDSDAIEAPKGVANAQVEIQN